MGMNFYYKIPLSKRKMKELQDLVTEYPDYYTIQEQLKEEEKSHCIHLGKRNTGWQFLWNYNNGKYYEANINSIRHFLYTGGGHIENEDGEKFSVETFFDDEIADSLYKDERHCDLAGYYMKHPEEKIHCNPTKAEFISDNLRFSRRTEFC